jgi:TolB protein
MGNLSFRSVGPWTLLLLLVTGTLSLGACRLSAAPAISSFASLPSVVYISSDASGTPQLFHTFLTGGSPTTSQLTSFQEATLIDFAPAAGGWPIALSLATDTGSEIALLPAEGAALKQLLDCPRAECTSPIWSPDGHRLIYERRDLAVNGAAAGRPHLWWLAIATGETIPVLQADHTTAHGARFSPDGNWLAYVIPAREGVEVYNLHDGRRLLLPGSVSAAAVWSNDSAWLLLSDLNLITYHGENNSDHLSHSHDYEEAVQLYRVSVGGAERLAEDRILLSPPDAAVDDAFPAWSPDDRWIAFGRKAPRAQSGRQLWLMRPDGSDARPLTTDPALQHGPPQWSPDGRFLLFQRYQLAAGNAAPEIWLLNVENSEMTLIATPGFLPAWLR